ncbi:MAG: Ribosomal protein [Bacteriovoracaceae bacterium]|nr:Ribosomal protein [Bacteriovoracaceae bacterium]
MKDKLKFDELTVEDLNNRLVDIADELLKARQKHRMGQFKKISEFPRLRKEIARIKTHLRLRELSVTENKKRA